MRINILMVLLFICFLGDLSNCDTPPDSVFLVKKEEIYLKVPKSVRGENFQIRAFRPIFLVSKKGNIILCSRSGLYAFDQRRNIVGKVWADTTMESHLLASPGNFLKICVSISLNDGDKIIATDILRRINIYDDKLKFLRSFIIPGYDFAPERSQILNDTILICSGRLLIKERKSSGIFVYKEKEYDGVAIYNMNNGKLLSHFLKTSGDDIERVYKKGASVYLYHFFTLLPNGNILCNRTTDHKIYEYDISGNLIYKYEEIPQHFVSIDKAEPISDKILSSRDSVSTLKRHRWLGTWSRSGCPSLFGEDIFIVPRRLMPPFYIDFYSLKKRKYLGFSNTGDKRFLFSDSLYIYLYENFKDSILTIGKYEPKKKLEVEIIGADSLPKGLTEAVLEALPEEWLDKRKEEVPILELDSLPKGLLEELLKVVVDSSKAIKDTTKYVFDVKDFNIIDTSGRKQPLVNYLYPDKSHILLFAGLFECSFPELYRVGLNFVRRNKKNFALCVIFSHPYKEELLPFIRGFELNALVSGNIDIERLKRFGIEFPGAVYIVLNKEGKIIDSFHPLKNSPNEYPDYPEEFLKRVKKKMR